MWPRGAGDLLAVFLQLSQSGEHFFAVLFRLHVRVHLLHDSVRIDQKSVPCGELGHSQIPDGIIGRRNVTVRIGEQLEASTLFGAKLLM